MTVPRYRRLFPLCFTLAWGACPLAPALHAQVQPVPPQLGAALTQCAQLMYAPNPDPGAVAAAYEAYYTAHPVEKNAHTQFYKRWKRELGHALLPIDPRSAPPTPRTSAATWTPRTRCVPAAPQTGVASDRSTGTTALHLRRHGLGLRLPTHLIDLDAVTNGV